MTHTISILQHRSSPVPPLHLASPPSDQVVSNSSFPSVTSSISLPSDSIDGSPLPPPPPPSAMTIEPRSPSIVDGIPVYAAVDKSKKKRQFQGSRKSDKAASHQQKPKVDAQLSDESDAPYPSTSFSPHRPPPPPTHRHQHHSRSHTEPHSASSLDNLPVYTLSDAPQPLTGDYGYVFSRTSPEGEQQQFVATPVRITPAPSNDVGAPKSHSTPIHRRMHHQSAASSPVPDGWRGGSRSPSPTVRSPSSTTQIATEILQQLASASLQSGSLHPTTDSLPNSSTLSQSFAGDRTTQATAEILQQLAAGSLNGLESVDSSARHQPLRGAALENLCCYLCC